QVLPDEPLYSSFITPKMVLDAYDGCVVGIPANTKADFLAFKEAVVLPVNGIVKRNYVNIDVFITVTSKEVD
ncbi:N-acetylmannosamine-6-phosphate 2-epimerase, partial [Staphylococcus aureus]